MAYKPSKEDVDRGLSITAIAGVITILVGASTLLVGEDEFEAYKVLDESKDQSHAETDRVAHVEIEKSINNFEKIVETYMVSNTQNLNSWAVGNYSLMYDAVSEDLLLLEDIENKTIDDKAKIRKLKARLERINRASEIYE